jgi:hypothetical protein
LGHNNHQAKRPSPISSTITCPHCWHRFEPGEFLAVARHPDLYGDSVLGESARSRFRPSRFTPDGLPIDPNGVECRDLACPECHLEVARSLIELAPLFVSIVGAPASGKSYFLASMAWQLRTVLPKFGWNFTDAHAAGNAVLQRNEQILFLADDPDTPVALEKTPTEGGGIYRSVIIKGRPVVLPTPFQFDVRPSAPEERQPGCVLVLYDNAGEHFMPGDDSDAGTMTEHLARSKVLLFLLDPTQDPRVRKAIAEHGGENLAAAAKTGAGSVRQESVLTETAGRLRRALGLRQTDRIKAPLIIALAKADLWQPLLKDVDLSTEPYGPGQSGSYILDRRRIGRTVSRCRTVIEDLMPEMASAADAAFKQVLYLPFTSLGCQPERVQQPDGDSMYAVRPRDIRPMWTAVPMLAALQAMSPDLLQTN